MSNAGRIGVIAVIAVVAFGAAFFLTGGDEDPNGDTGTDLAVGGDQTSASTTADAEDGEPSDPCLVSEVVPVDESPYQVSVATEPDPPVPQGTTFEVVVQRDGAPLEGATVCMSSDMSEMSHEGVSEQAVEIGEGRYQLAPDFGMRGSWSGGVVIIEEGQTAASMPVSFDVQ